MDQTGVHMVGGDGGDGLDPAIAHDDGVALDMAEAEVVALHIGMEHLPGVLLCHAAGDDPGLGVMAVEDNIHIGVGRLVAVGHQLLGQHDLAVIPFGYDLGVALGGVHTADLAGVHDHSGALLQIDDGLRVQNTPSGAVARAIVYLHIGHLGILAHIEGVDAIVL